MAPRVYVVSSLIKGSAQMLAQCAPFPWLSPLVAAFGEIIQLCENVSSNRNAAGHLAHRCQDLILALSGQETLSPTVAEAVALARSTLDDIQERMRGWASLGRLQSFISQGHIASDIEKCHQEITDCCTKFEITSHLGILQWQEQFEMNRQLDHQEILQYLGEISHAQTITNDRLMQNTELLRSLQLFMQKGLSEFVEGDTRHNGLQSNLYEMTNKRGDLLPDLELSHGEVRRIGQFPVGGSAAMDIWEGYYLQNEKVAIKAVRAVNANHRSLERFRREVAIWHKVWKLDHGKHILPFYGFCQSDGPYPYMISPWQPNGIAIDYVKRNSSEVNHIALVRDIAEGLRILHKMNPPIVHGDMKGSNIVIDAMGRALIADFGVVEDITGIPFTQSRGVSDSYRWFAPELCVGQGILSLQADIYAYGMTVLELISHLQPFSYIKHTTEVVVEVSKGNRPPRPTDPAIFERGLNDNLWRLLGYTWRHDRLERPDIDAVIELLALV